MSLYQQKVIFSTYLPVKRPTFGTFSPAHLNRASLESYFSLVSSQSRFGKPQHKYPYYPYIYLIVRRYFAFLLVFSIWKDFSFGPLVWGLLISLSRGCKPFFFFLFFFFFFVFCEGATLLPNVML